MMGATLIGFPGSKRFMRVMHMREGLPSTSALQEPLPQMPAELKALFEEK